MGTKAPTVVKGKRVVADRTEVTLLLHHYRTAKDAEAAAKEAATLAHDALLEIAGDAEILVDGSNLMLCKLPERHTTTLPAKEAIALYPKLEKLLRTTYYRVVTR
jgi:hypothetical protein